MAKKGYSYDNLNRWWSRTKDDHFFKPSEAKKLGIVTPKGFKPEMTPGMMAYSLLKAYTTPAKKKGKGWLRKESMNRGARALRAVIWSHILDREVVSALLAIDRHNLSFASCLDWSVNRREHLLRWAKEQRNLLPILASIDYRHWSRDDLFSRKLWVRGSRLRTAVDRSDFSIPTVV
ncbi:hypothetical protein [Xanthomonas campestris]|uniref:hypothetical protein n=1 Tax=Xanthomonas campestris TaxID=339 RepID=UPI0024B7190D|nr:hypothetical protein [Xanthomonas campestris]WHO90910.1 hypothetical protein QMY62_11010 [Xanthomonas campestris]